MIKEIGNVGKIIITEKLKKEIDFLHLKVGTKEWSGILLYKHITGNFKKLNNLIFKAENFYLMDIGNGGTTGFEYNGDIVELYDNIPEAIDMNTGLLHSHHDMGAFHSGTDMKELENNSDKYNYYISLVVDFNETYKCKIGFPSKSKITYNNTIRDTKGNFINNKKTIKEDVILIGDLNIEIEKNNNTDNWFLNRYNKIKTAIYNKTLNITHNGNVNKFENFENFYNTGPYNSKQLNLYDDYLDDSPKKSEEFLIAMLNINSDMSNKLTIQQSLNELEKLSEIEFEQFKVMLESNLAILHFNIYGESTDYLLESHIEEAILNLDKYFLKEHGTEFLTLLNTL